MRAARSLIGAQLGFGLLQKKILCCVPISDGAILSKSGIRPLAVQVPAPSDWPVTLPCFNVIGQLLSGLSGFN